MCGRIFQIHNLRKLLQLAGTRLLRNGKRGGQNYNAGPTNFIPAVRQANSGTDKDQQSEQQSQYRNEKFEEQISDGLNQDWLDQAVEGQTEQFSDKLVSSNNNRELCFLPFGLAGPQQLLINLRIEDVGSKKFFAKYLNTSRCAIIASGYYEWNDKKQGFCFKHKQQECLYLAGIVLENQAIIIFTREATKEIGHIHPRMPVLLEEDELDAWLDGQNNSWGSLVEQGIMNEKKKKWTQISFYEAAPYVNSIKNKSAECILSKQEYQQKQDKVGIKKFFSVQKKEPDKKEQKVDHKVKELDNQLQGENIKQNMDEFKELKKDDDEVAKQENAQLYEKLAEISKPIKKIKKNEIANEKDKDKFEKDFQDAYKKFFNPVK